MKLRKTLATALSAVMLLMAVPFNMMSATAYGDSDIKLVDGTYEIYTADGLAEFVNIVNGTSETTTQNLKANGKLMADITFNESDLATFADWGNTVTPTDVWTPIGKDNSNSYNGTFDGQGHTIKGIYCTSDSVDVGLFGYIMNATIKNVITDTCYFKTTKSYKSSGSVVGCSSSLLSTKSYISGCVSKKCSVISNYFSSGIIGYNNSADISDCTNESTNIIGDGFVCGISGYSSGNITRCVNKADITSKYGVGGICGIFDYSSASISYCVNLGNITSIGYSAGGIASQIRKGSIENCINFGDVETKKNSAYFADGGVVGMIGQKVYSDNGYVSNCYSTGMVTGTSKNPIGVIDMGSISDSYYLSDSETDSYDGTTAQTDDFFNSDEVAHMFNFYFGHTAGTNDELALLADDLSNQVLKVTFTEMGTDTTTDVYVNNGSAVTVPTEYVGCKFLDAEGNEFDITNLITEDTALTVIPAPTYTVTIPAQVDFGTLTRKHENATDKIKSVEFNVIAESDYLFENQKSVSVSVLTNLKLANADSSSELAYTLSLNADNINADTATTIMTLGNSADDDTATTALTASIDQSKITIEDIYTGTLTFTVSLSDGEGA